VMDILPITIDLGSANFKCGLRDETSFLTFPNIIGRTKYLASMVGMGSKDSYVGDEAQSKRGILTMKNPVKEGIIQDVDDFEKIIHHAYYNELRVAPEEHPTFITETPFNPDYWRARTTLIMFETFNVDSLYIGQQGSLVPYAYGRTTGVTLDIGHGVMQTSAMYEGFVQPKSIQRQTFAGESITKYLQQLITENGQYLKTTSEYENIREMKEQIAIVSQDYESDLTSVHNDIKYELNSGLVLDINQKTFRCMEPLFQPQLLGVNNKFSSTQSFLL